MAKNRVAELRMQDFQARKQEMLDMHQADREQLENDHLEKYQQFNKEWDEQMRLENEEHD